LKKAYPQDKELQLGVLELRNQHFKEAEEYFRKLVARIESHLVMRLHQHRLCRF
jgi:Flp pilus assembly protein TadD